MMSLPRRVCSTPSEAEPVSSRPALSEMRYIAADEARSTARSPARWMPCVLDHVSKKSVTASPPATPSPWLSGTAGSIERIAACRSSGLATALSSPESTSSTPP
eukprot:scaffold38647_cov24-Tisochrysis_lutea.AAC.1